MEFHKAKRLMQKAAISLGPVQSKFKSWSVVYIVKNYKNLNEVNILHVSRLFFLSYCPLIITLWVPYPIRVPLLSWPMTINARAPPLVKL